jgi:hypothetical protein
MKRIYIKPEIKTLQLRLNAFITAGSGTGTNYGMIGTGGNEENIGDAGEGDLPSRYLRESMWDDMD